MLALLVVCAGLAFGTFFTPGMTLLSNLAEARGLDYGYASALINLAWAPGQTIGAAGRRRARAGDERRRAVPRCSPPSASRRSSCCCGRAGRRARRARRLRAVKKVLVANRGEIALRVFRAARELGLGTVAVVAPDDTGSLHARSADETVEIASYLDPAEHIRAARETGADAIHPGYGFLAENGDFAEAVEAAGLTWVGPPADALRRAATSSRRSASRPRPACRPCPRRPSRR